VTPNDGVENGSVVFSNNLTILNTVPTEPTVQTPVAGQTYVRFVNISWTAATDADNDTLAYNVTLRNQDGSLNYTITTGLSQATTDYYWDGLNVSQYGRQEYKIRVDVYDDESHNYSIMANNFTLLFVEPPTNFSVRDGISSWDNTTLNTHDATPDILWDEHEEAQSVYTHFFAALNLSEMEAGNYLFTAYVNDSNLTVSSGLTHRGTSWAYYVRLIPTSGDFNGTELNTTINITNSLPAVSNFGLGQTHDPTPTMNWSVTDADDGSDDHWPADNLTDHVRVGNVSDASAYYSNDTADNESTTVTPAIPWGVPSGNFANRTVKVIIWATDGNNEGISSNLTTNFTLYDSLPDVKSVYLGSAGDVLTDCSGGCALVPLEHGNATMAVMINVSDADNDCSNSTHQAVITLCLNDTAAAACSETSYNNFTFVVDKLESAVGSECLFVFSENKTNGTPRFFDRPGKYKLFVNATSQAGGRPSSFDAEQQGIWEYGTLKAVGYVAEILAGDSSIELGEWNRGTQSYTIVNWGNDVLDLRWNASNPTTGTSTWNLNGTDFQVDDDDSQANESAGVLSPVYLNGTKRLFNPASGLQRCISALCSDASLNETLDTYFHIMPPTGLRSGTYNTTIEITLDTHT